MAEIQRKIVKRGKRNAVSRLFHAKTDQGAIAAWRLDLNRILHIFNVRPAAFVWSSLTGRSQTELAINTNVVVSDIRHDVTNTQTIVSSVRQGVFELQHNVVNTYTIVSDIHRTMVAGRRGTDGENRSVGVTGVSFIVKHILTVA